jgi:hypothetical protein
VLKGEIKMTKLAFKFSGFEVNYEGSEKYLDTRLLPLLEALEKSQNEDVKIDLLAILEGLDINQADLDGCLAHVKKLDEELASKMTEFNQKSADLLGNMATLASDSKESPPLLTAIKNLQEMNQSFNLQYLSLQQQMQDENRRFSLLSNIMKTKHDNAKNSINNLR